ncbi:hypothetical protein JXO59_03200 [candidate division KSB1 bacterium]|nr:hypothetical protein [candidate division KSB1 bacterium]
MKTHSQMESAYIDSIQGVNEIAGFNTGAVYSRANQAIFELFQMHIEKLGLLQAGLSLNLTAAGSFISVTLLCFGALLVIQEQLLLGQFMAAYSLLSYILPSINTLVGTYIHFQGAHIPSVPSCTWDGMYHIKLHLRNAQSIQNLPAGGHLLRQLDHGAMGADFHFAGLF